jgi:protoheme IX farnesyltransferase
MLTGCCTPSEAGLLLLLLHIRSGQLIDLQAPLIRAPGQISVLYPTVTCFWAVGAMARPCSAAGSRLLQLAYSHSASCCSTAAESLSTSGFGPSTTGLGLQMLRQSASNAAKQGFSSAAQQAEPVLRQKSAYRRLKGVVNDYKKLSKFRLSALVALTASAGYAAGSGDSIDYAQLAWTSLGTLGAAACANTLNQLYEVFNDSRMTRTANRPLPAGRLSTRHAKVFALLTGAAGLWVLAEKVSSLALVG